MPALSGATVSLRLHPLRRRFRPPPSAVVVILNAAGDPTYMAVHYWQSCVSGGWKPPLEQSATRRHLGSNADCFSELPQNLSLCPIISFLTVFGFVLYTVWKRCKIEGKLLVITNKKSHMDFRLVLESVTLSDPERRNGRVVCVISPNLVAFGAYYVKVVEDILIPSASEM